MHTVNLSNNFCYKEKRTVLRVHQSKNNQAFNSYSLLLGNLPGLELTLPSRCYVRCKLLNVIMELLTIDKILVGPKHGFRRYVLRPWTEKWIKWLDCD